MRDTVLFAAVLFLPAKRPVADEVRVLRLRGVARRDPSPSGILHEIPAMGAFIL